MSRKTLNIITIVLFVICVIIGIFTFANIGAIEKPKDTKVWEDFVIAFKLLNPLFYWTLLLSIVTVILALVMPLPAMLKNPKLLKRTLFIIVGIIVAFGVVFLLSQGKPDNDTIMSTLQPLQQDTYKEGFFIANMNVIGAGIALGLAIVAVLWSAFRGLIRK